MCASHGKQLSLPLRPNYAHELGLYARAITPSASEKLRAKAGCAACIYFCKTAAATFGAALSSCSDVPVSKRALRASVKRLVKLARKPVLEISSQKCFRNLIP
ncbi:hypothetical protein [uncultured Campylobacter sp.]|uniref:hypothetical protein n=1 Tax=uncultured Campylobacter sp. TaxID=218934 RepID=UPI00261DC7FF|nr:hypothetical protein [uncultured Campylobacter sp.]